MPTIDADAHVIESHRTWSYLAENERRFAPMTLRVVQGNDGKLTNTGGSQREFWYAGDEIQPADKNIDREGTTDEAREMGNIKTRLEHMDQLKIDVQVLYPTIFLVPTAREADQELAQFRAYNRWMADIYKASNGRLRWAAMAPLFSPHRLLDELKFAKEHGACSVFVRPFECERYVGDSYFEPLFKAAADLDLAITFHSGNASYHNGAFHVSHNFGRFKLAMVSQFHWLLEFGIPKKYPNIRWAFIEASASWVPYVLGDVEKRLKRKGQRLGSNPLKDNNIWVTVETTDDIPYIIKRAGDDNLIIGTDYGHTDTSAQIEALRILREGGEVPGASVDKILGPNAIKLYGLTLN
jgi:uncharacterized protein